MSQLENSYSKVLEQAAHSKREDLASMKQRLEAASRNVTSTHKDLGKTLQELQHTKGKLSEQCEETCLVNRNIAFLNTELL